MAWAKFLDNFDWKPRASVTIAYRAGHTYQITKRCEEAAMKVNAIQRLKKEHRHSEPVPVEDDKWASQVVS